jgi:hypothetical protein
MQVTDPPLANAHTRQHYSPSSPEPVPGPEPVPTSVPTVAPHPTSEMAVSGRDPLRSMTPLRPTTPLAASTSSSTSPFKPVEPVLPIPRRMELPAARPPPKPVFGALRSHALLSQLGPDPDRPRAHPAGRAPARVYLRECGVYDTLVDSLRHLDVSHTGSSPRRQLSAAVAAAAAKAAPSAEGGNQTSVGIGETAQQSSCGGANRTVFVPLSVKMATITSMRESLVDGLWALHSARPKEPLQFLAEALDPQPQAQP